MFFIIYKTTNIVNNKYYIGKHQTKNIDDGYVGSGKILKKAIEKYGKENFVTEILHMCNSEKHMNTLEKILVVPDKEINYNLCSGGKGGFGYLNTNGLNNQNKDFVAIAKKVSKKLKGRKNPRFSEISKWHHAAGLVKYDNFTGRKHSDETKKKISEARRNRTKLSDV